VFYVIGGKKEGTTKKSSQKSKLEGGEWEKGKKICYEGRASQTDHQACLDRSENLEGQFGNGDGDKGKGGREKEVWVGAGSGRMTEGGLTMGVASNLVEVPEIFWGGCWLRRRGARSRRETCAKRGQRKK